MHTIPTKTRELQVLSLLRQRMNLSAESLSRYNRLQSGFIGEQRFASLLKEHLRVKPIILYGLLLEFERSYFQIDCLMIFPGKVYLIDVKYFQNNYLFDEEKWTNLHTKKKVRNPIHQLRRCEDLLQEFLSSHGIFTEIKAYVVFVHETFTLYQTPLKLPFIFPTQVKRFIEKLNQIPNKTTEIEQNIANMLIQHHEHDSPHEKVPHYQFSELIKGLFCMKCESVLRQYGRTTLLCQKCGEVESTDAAVIKGVVDFSILLKDEKITTSIIFEWCGKLLTKRVVKRILKKYLILKWQGRSSYYIFPDEPYFDFFDT